MINLCDVVCSIPTSGMSIHVLKAVAIVTSVHLNYDFSIIFVASHFLSVKVSPERR